MEVMGIFMANLAILRPNGIFYGHLVHFVAIWYIFCPFWYSAPRKIWQPCNHVVLQKRIVLSTCLNLMSASYTFPQSCRRCDFFCSCGRLFSLFFLGLGRAQAFAS
jgi:hypothetical protein